MSKINLPLDIDSLEITAQSTDSEGNIILDVISKKKSSVCHNCGKVATKPNGVAPSRLIRHLPILDKPVYLRIRPIRYSCEHCEDNATTTEQYDWCDRNASTSKGLEDYILRCIINSTVEDVAKKERAGIKVIQGILNRRVTMKVNWESVKAMKTIGIDEISTKKGHQSYVTIISAKTDDNRSPIVIAVISGRSKEDIQSFLESIPSRLKKTVNQVCTDMYDGYVNAAIEVFGVQSLVVDRYHVAKLYRKPLDKLRIKEMERLKSELSTEEYAQLEGMMWILRKKHECLTKEDKNKLEFLYKSSPDLKKAHSYALRLTNIFNTHCNRKSAVAKMNRWIVAVEKSDLIIFNVFIRTIKKYQPYIGNYFKARKNSGFVEGLNNKIKVLKRRCYGCLKLGSMFQRLFLDLQGFEFYA